MKIQSESSGKSVCNWSPGRWASLKRLTPLHEPAAGESQEIIQVAVGQPLTLICKSTFLSDSPQDAWPRCPGALLSLYFLFSLLLSSWSALEICMLTMRLNKENNLNQRASITVTFRGLYSRSSLGLVEKARAWVSAERPNPELTHDEGCDLSLVT